MKSIAKIIFVLAMLAGLSAAAEVQDRHLTGFHAISSSTSCDLVITQGGTESVKVDASPKVIDNIITEVRDGELRIYMKKGFHWDNFFNHGKMIIYISVRNISGISMSGAGDVSFKSGLKADRLALNISGSGDFDGRVDVNLLTTQISGSGDIQLRGRATNCSVKTSGSGDFDGRDLSTASANVSTSGSGDVSIRVSENLMAHSSGSGDIHYAGSPKSVMKSSTGSGDIERI
ncbi:putative autotransporter adhesin-like protein [Mucilaginibacter yixingensis]|uniref:Putative autotransporter adhesin-like protein n=1 Tax=Mucilaginibacter yixingensis TaxID=1295612 RepID=A0A2T5J851_9SPHI|nr:head GIN domain-containing protein [Mucilaginibacter yixingensis]PTQ95637.1 putative autotransporter adhesin-like protein [Mucilaginibacter yixingensis]